MQWKKKPKTVLLRGFHPQFDKILMLFQKNPYIKGVLFWLLLSTFCHTLMPLPLHQHPPSPGSSPPSAAEPLPHKQGISRHHQQPLTTLCVLAQCSSRLMLLQATPETYMLTQESSCTSSWSTLHLLSSFSTVSHRFKPSLNNIGPIPVKK